MQDLSTWIGTITGLVALVYYLRDWFFPRARKSIRYFNYPIVRSPDLDYLLSESEKEQGMVTYTHYISLTINGVESIANDEMDRHLSIDYGDTTSLLDVKQYDPGDIKPSERRQAHKVIFEAAWNAEDKFRANIIIAAKGKPTGPLLDARVKGGAFTSGMLSSRLSNWILQWSWRVARWSLLILVVLWLLNMRLNHQSAQALFPAINLFGTFIISVLSGMSFALLAIVPLALLEYVGIVVESKIHSLWLCAKMLKQPPLTYIVRKLEQKFDIVLWVRKQIVKPTNAKLPKGNK